MGFWAGMNEGLTYVLDKKAEKATEDRAYAFKREEYQQTLLEGRRERYLGIVAKLAETDNALKGQVRKAVSLGFEEKAVIALQDSGQLELLLEQYDKNKRVDPEFVKDLNLSVLKYLEEAGNKAMSTALVNGVSTKRDTTDPEESSMALVEAIYSATTPEELDKISQTLYASEAPTAAPFKLDFGYASGPEESETKNIRNEIAAALQPQFVDSFAVNERTGDITLTQNADKTVANLYAIAEERARDLAFGPQRSKTPTDAAAEVANKIRTAVATGNVGAKDILDNFDAVMVDPKAFAENFTPAQTPSVVRIEQAPTTTESQVGGVGGMLAAPPALTNPPMTGKTFDELVDEFGGTGQ